MPFGIEDAKQWLTELDRVYQQERMYLTELDQAIGDGDHGINMARGFSELGKKLETASYEDLGSLFRDAGMVLLSKVGGASGPLYGTAFIKAAGVLKDKQEATIEDLAEAMEEALKGLEMRGKASAGDKTMLDVWIPVAGYLKSRQGNADWQELMSLSKERMEATKDLEAKKGRASYLGQRSIGHIDPGAASSHFLFTELAKSCKGAQL
ncbi:dihydroxyacetone kinase subunit DhaL [Bacillus sp. REN3]|uniref:dihydroxyacetone kinase subunit DhaL n=1 Tax=Bacillus sp. REN3 TaxID=2802440 RepID=UPI001AEE6C33|nr:dihydroxyacetone kinase subunit DhaL [Bacillus sp. REN3]